MSADITSEMRAREWLMSLRVPLNKDTPSVNALAALLAEVAAEARAQEQETVDLALMMVSMLDCPTCAAGTPGCHATGLAKRMLAAFREANTIRARAKGDGG